MLEEALVYSGAFLFKRGNKMRLNIPEIIINTMIEEGKNTKEIAAALGITRKQLYAWGTRHKVSFISYDLEDLREAAKTMTCRQMAKYFHTTTKAIYYRCERYDIHPQPVQMLYETSRRKEKETHYKLVLMQEAPTHNAKELAGILNCTLDTVYKKCRKYGIQHQ